MEKVSTAIDDDNTDYSTERLMSKYVPPISSNIPR